MRNRFSLLKKITSFFLIFLLLFHTTGCNYYVSANVITRVKKADLEFGETTKNFYLHIGEDAFILNDVAVDSMNVSGTRGSFFVGLYYSHEGRYGKKEMLNEVHIYTNNPSVFPDFPGRVVIPIKNINEIRIIEKDQLKTDKSRIGIILLVIAGIGVAALIVVGLSGMGNTAAGFAPS